MMNVPGLQRRRLLGLREGCASLLNSCFGAEHPLLPSSPAWRGVQSPGPVHGAPQESPQGLCWDWEAWDSPSSMCLCSPGRRAGGSWQHGEQRAFGFWDIGVFAPQGSHSHLVPNGTVGPFASGATGACGVPSRGVIARH